jgi:hypothetical protein
METLTNVSVYAVGDTGATGHRLGGGVLVLPRLVIADQAIAAQLSAGQRFRVATAPASGSGIVEIVDVDCVKTVHDEAAGSLVGLELAGVSHSPFADLGVAGDESPVADLQRGAAPEEAREAMRHHMVATTIEAIGNVPDASMVIGDDDPDDNASPWCKWLGMGCHKSIVLD